MQSVLIDLPLISSFITSSKHSQEDKALVKKQTGRSLESNWVLQRQMAYLHQYHILGNILRLPEKMYNEKDKVG